MKNIHILPTDKPSRLHLQNGNLVLHRLQYTLVAQHIYITNDEIVTEYSPGLYFIDVYTGKNYVFSPIKIDKESIHAAPFHSYMNNGNMCKRIIMTTDPILISNGVQAIDDEFLEWFVSKANDSGKPIDIVKIDHEKVLWETGEITHYKYKIIIPKEEPDYTALLQPVGTKQECKGSFKDCFKPLDECVCDTIKQQQKKILIEMMQEDEELGLYDEELEEAAERLSPNSSWKLGFIAGAKWRQERMYSKEEMIATFHYGHQIGMNDILAIQSQNSPQPMPKPDLETLKKEWFEQFKKK